MPNVGDVPNECSQVIVVTAGDYDVHWPPETKNDDMRPKAKLSAWFRDPDPTRKDREWQPYKKDIAAVVGWNGVGPGSDDTGKTPVGSFALGQTFGRRDDLDIAFGDYFTVDAQDYWDTDWRYRQREIAGGKTLDPPSQYNEHFRAAAEPAREAESLNQEAYNLAVFVDHNPTNQPGWGCAIFLHCDDESDTWGCITIDEDVLAELLTWLKPDGEPYVTVLVAKVDGRIGRPWGSADTRVPG